MNASEMTNEELAKNIEYTAEELPNYGGFECADELLEAAARLRNVTVCTDNSEVIAELQRRLKVAEDALKAASDAFRFCIEQCELELGPKMIGKLCDDGKAVERAIAAIREEGARDGILNQ